ncbi:MAG: sensor histidine kinase [Candidatus Riflebacteria bacterium]|nr:sensor histidine kinase [Candidatus Riflebacteria bacterium]
MTILWQDVLSTKMIGMKSQLGNLVELVESWVLSLSHEEDRSKRLSDLLACIENPENGLRQADRTTCIEQLNTLLGRNEAPFYASTGFRMKLQNMFREAVESMSRDLDEILQQVSKLRDLTNAGIEPNGGFILAQEDERKRISREIHDGPAQNLASLTMRIDFCLENIEKKEVLQKELIDLKDSISRCLKDIRRFIFDLRPMALDDLGLLPTLEQFIAGFRARTSMNVQFNREGEVVSLSSERELAAFRVIQEAVNNTHRHSHAKTIRIFISFNQGKKSVSVAVTDDGAGFDLVAVKKAYPSLKKLGLLSMEERIRLAGGEFSLASNPGEGTVVSFTLYK